MNKRGQYNINFCKIICLKGSGKGNKLQVGSSQVPHLRLKPDKVKVKLSLGIWRSVGIVSLILNLSTR
jgi:hypothetical protein